MVITERSIHAYLEALSAHEPTPGGGSVAALVGALAAGLGVMVANFTLGRKKYARVSAEVEERLANLSQALQVLEDLVQEDIDAYGAVGAGFAMPRGTEVQSKQRAQGTSSRLQCRPLRCSLQSPMRVWAYAIMPCGWPSMAIAISWRMPSWRCSWRRQRCKGA